MPTTVTQSSSVRCNPNDKTPPATPRIARAIAFDKAKAGAQFHRNRTSNRSNGRADPIYLELHNVEVGTRIELINLSSNPEAKFDKKNTVELPLTGRDVKNRQASVYLKTAQMAKLGIKPGDMFQIRVVDAAGNHSKSVLGEFESASWANGQVFERGRSTAEAGAQFSMLDGEGVRKNVIAKAINDTRAPVVLEKNVTIEKKGNGQKSMNFNRALEPHANVEVLNSRTGEKFSGRVDAEGKLNLPLKNLEEGDPLLVCTTDNNGIAGKDVELVYSSKCKDGKAPKLRGGLGARLGGVID